MQRISIQAADVWAYWQKNRQVLRTKPRDIAENQDCGIVIELSTSGDYPEITVFADDDEIERILAYGPADCNAAVLEAYEDYITGNAQTKLAAYYKFHEDEQDAEEEEETAEYARKCQIDDREEELKTAVYDLLTTVFTDTDIPELDAVTDEATEILLRVLYQKYKYPIYRPMVLEDDAGEFFVEYPYEHMVFEEAAT